MNEIENILENNGPLLSSDIKSNLSNKKKSDEAIRQRISRARGVVKRLNTISFPKGEKFLFLASQYKTSEFYQSLIDAFHKTRSIYYNIVKTLNCLTGCVPLEKFKVICASRIKDIKRKTITRVIKELKSIEIIKEFTDKDNNIWIELNQLIDFDKKQISDYSIINILQETLYESLKEWLRKNNIGSYYKINEFSQFCDFYWDITAPSYLLPFITKGNKILPGFVVIDILPQYQINIDEIKYYINKLKSSYLRKNTRPFLPILIGLSFDINAYEICKQEGILVTTPKNLFGEKIESLIKDIINLFKNARNNIKKGGINKIEKIFKLLAKSEGKFNNLRGSLFEMIIGHFIYNIEASKIELGKKIINPEGKSAEIDIYSLKGQKEINIYECKGKNINSLIDEIEISKWFDRISIIHKWIKDNPSNSNKSVKYEFWTTTKFNSKAINLLKKYKKGLKKYTIAWKNGDEIIKIGMDENLNSLVSILREHFVSNKV